MKGKMTVCIDYKDIESGELGKYTDVKCLESLETQCLSLTTFISYFQCKTNLSHLLC